MLRFSITFLCGVLAGLSLWWAVPFLFDVASSHDRSLDRAYRSIHFRTSRAEAVKGMRSPGREHKDFYLAQPAGYEFEYAAGKSSGAAYFLSWGNGIDWCYTVGFDNEDNAIYKAQGGT